MGDLDRSPTVLFSFFWRSLQPQRDGWGFRYISLPRVNISGAFPLGYNDGGQCVGMFGFKFVHGRALAVSCSVEIEQVVVNIYPEALAQKLIVLLTYTSRLCCMSVMG